MTKQQWVAFRGQWHVLVFQGAAVQFDHVVAAPVKGGEEVHDPAADAGVSVFGILGQLGQPEPFHIESQQLSKGESEAGGQRGR
jgi:hypothetical protein